MTATDPHGANGSTPSGVASIAIYDSINGGSFTLFATVRPSDPSATFTGHAGNTYAFYSVATDEAGNVQPVPTEPQATITVANTPTSTPTATVVIGEQPLFERKLKKGKPVGKPLLTGFTLDFGVPLNSNAASNRANYQVDTVSTKKVKKKVEHHSASDHQLHRLYSPRATPSNHVRGQRRRSRPAARSPSWAA